MERKSSPLDPKALKETLEVYITGLTERLNNGEIKLKQNKYQCLACLDTTFRFIYRAGRKYTDRCICIKASSIPISEIGITTMNENKQDLVYAILFACIYLDIDEEKFTKTLKLRYNGEEDPYKLKEEELFKILNTLKEKLVKQGRLQEFEERVKDELSKRKAKK